MPREDAPETCAETIHLTCGGESGRHLDAIVAPLLIHDLPVTVWWPDEPPFGSAPANDLLDDGRPARRRRLELARHGAPPASPAGRDRRRACPIAISDFALVRQSRWREAIASIFDIPDFLPYLRHLRRIAVTYGVRDEGGAETDEHRQAALPRGVARVATRDAASTRPLAPLTSTVRPAAARHGRGAPLAATRRRCSARPSGSIGRDVAVVIRPVLSEMPPGTTLRVELLADWRGSELRADVTAEQEAVHVRVWQDGVHGLERGFTAPRRTDIDLLAEAIEAGGRDPVAVGTLALAAELAGGAVG